MQGQSVRRRRAALAAGAAALATLAATAPATGGAAAAAADSAGRPAVQLVLDPPSPRTVYEDNLTHLSGELSNGRADKLVILRARAGGRWQHLGTTRTAADGSFGFRYVPHDPGTVQLQALHPVGHGKVSSQVRTLDVLDRRVFLVMRPSYPTFGDIVAHGRVSPAGRHRRVVVQHMLHGRWVTAGSGYTDVDGRYAIALRNNLPGPWTVRAYWPGWNPPAGSGELSLRHRYTVNPVLHPVVTRVTRHQLGGSYHVGCPVGPASLRNVSLTVKTFGPVVHRGTIVVSDSIVGPVIAAFREALATRYPVRRVFPASFYGGNDVVMMRHDDTSGFNCRHVTGDPTRMSPHSYGIAVDVDTVENPYQDIHGRWWPRNFGKEYRSRTRHRPGMLYDGSPVTKAWTTRGFQWGGDWSHPDYQHFDTLGGGPQQPAPPSAGPLSASDLPAPASFGTGWRRYGDGGFAAARPGPEASRAVLPIGCARRPALVLPRARFALEGSYRSGSGSLARSVVLRFRGAPAAASYFSGLVRSLAACTAADGPSGVRVATAHAGATSFAGVRVYGRTERWRERDFVRGPTVTVTLAAQGRA